MSATAVTLKTSRGFRFYEAPVGKKVVMAVTGVILFGYLVAHLLGNLQIFIPPDAAGERAINVYAHFLHSKPALLWGARLVLLACVLLHITASVQLWLMKRRARPIGYVKKDDVPASYAARTMLWSGPIIAAFVVFHILHLTTGDVGPVEAIDANGLPDVHQNVVNGFSDPAIAGAYIFAMLLLWPHLFHGLWSMFQSLGISHPRYTPLLKRFAAIFSSVIALGNIFIPVAVLTHIVR